MFLSLCFLLTLASYGFSGVQSRVPAAFPGSKDPTFLNGGHSNNGVSDKVQQPGVTFFGGGIFAFMGMLPMPKPSEPPTDDYNEGFRAEADQLKEFDEKLKATLKGLDELEEDVKAHKSKASKRFLDYY